MRDGGREGGREGGRKEGMEGFELVTMWPLRVEQLLTKQGVSFYLGSFIRTLNCITSV